MKALHRLALHLCLYVKPRLRLLVTLLTGCVLFFFLPDSVRQPTRILMAWDSSIGLYLLLTIIMMGQSDIAKIRSRAARQDEGRVLILMLTIAAVLASLAAIIAELAFSKTVNARLAWQPLALTGATILLSWLFMQTIFALHYAHEYYTLYKGGVAKGLLFPGEEMPDYGDFIYFSFIIGATAQTSDVAITSKTIRNTVSFHSVFVFFYNTIILALMVNIGAGLF